MDIPRPEYPRPDFARDEWQTLNGQWEFSFDEPVFDKTIQVPFCCQSKASGIGDTDYHEKVWYRRKFILDKQPAGKTVLLHFGAVDYKAEVWLNGQYLGSHEGGHTPFSFCITGHVKYNGANVVQLCATDDEAASKPRGKQTWARQNFGCWYTPTTGIWQSVWLEYAGADTIQRIKITPDTTNLTALCEVYVSTSRNARVTLKAELAKNGAETATELLAEATALCHNGYGKAVFTFADLDIRREELLWSPEHPHLVMVQAVLDTGDPNTDKVRTYFGLRSSGTSRGALTLNDDPYFQRLILDQGYWPDSLLTPPSDQAIKDDIQLAKQMGFNGARKHQKIEDPRYYYWADRLGLLVWGEMPSGYEFNDEAIRRTNKELTEFVSRDYNHPCIVAWVPVNESWGVRGIRREEQRQSYVNSLYSLLHALDPTRWVSGNDGWEQTGHSDICAVHDYALFPTNLDKYADMEKVLAGFAENRFLYADENGWSGQPVVMTEYGGVSLGNDQSGWGYYTGAGTEEEYLQRIGDVTRFLVQSGKFAGFCYTQLTDVQQEVNGLLTPQRQPKVPLEQLQKIFGVSRWRQEQTNEGL